VTTRGADTFGLEIDPDSSALGQIWGRTAQYDFHIASTSGDLDLQYAVTFVPPVFVHLLHQADRLAAAAGEPVSFSLTITSDCDAPITGAVEIHLDLEGLEWVRGSAKLDGEAIDDPTPRGDRIYYGVTIPASGGKSTLTYVARRLSGAIGEVSSTATAHIVGEDGTDYTVSVPGHAMDSSGSGSGLDCQCAAAGGDLSGALAALLGLTIVARRRRARSC
jgi:hypothetical protein